MRLIRERAVWNAIPLMRFDPRPAKSSLQGWRDRDFYMIGETHRARAAPYALGKLGSQVKYRPLAITGCSQTKAEAPKLLLYLSGERLRAVPAVGFLLHRCTQSVNQWIPAIATFESAAHGRLRRIA